jgi:ABC-type transporter MlaC component
MRCDARPGNSSALPKGSRRFLTIRRMPHVFPILPAAISIAVMRRFAFSLPAPLRLPLAAGLALWLACPPVSAGPVEDAVVLVEKTVQALSDAASGASAQEGVQTVLTERFDLRAMAYATLPETVRAAAPQADLDAFTAAYRAYLAREFVRRSTGGEGGGMRVLGTRQPKQEFIIVGTKVYEPGRPDRVVEWYVAAMPPARILNATVDGVLITAQQKRDFGDILEARGLAALAQALATDFKAPGDSQ